MPKLEIRVLILELETRTLATLIRDRGLAPKDHQQEMAYGEPNGHVTDDVTLFSNNR